MVTNPRFGGFSLTRFLASCHSRRAQVCAGGTGMRSGPLLARGSSTHPEVAAQRYANMRHLRLPLSGGPADWTTYASAASRMPSHGRV
jgi:hypothetical protein